MISILYSCGHLLQILEFTFAHFVSLIDFFYRKTELTSRSYSPQSLAVDFFDGMPTVHFVKEVNWQKWAQHALRENVNCSSRSFVGIHVHRLPNTHTWPTHPQVYRLTHPSSSWLQHILSFSAASLDWDASVLTHITHSLLRHTQ